MKRIIILIIIISFFYKLEAQVNFKDAVGLYEDGSYQIALKQFKKLYRKKKDDIDLNYYIAMCYLKNDGIKSEALSYLKKIKKNTTATLPEDLDFQIARATFHNHEFEKAKTIFLQYKENNRSIITTEEIREINRFIEVCDNAKELVKNPINVTFINLGKNINSKWSDYDPFVTEDGQQLVYTSNKKYISDFQELIHNAYWSYPEYNDDGSEWRKKKSFGSKVNTESYEIVVGMSHNGEKVFINLKGFIAEDDIFITSKTGKRFNELQNLTETINSKFIEDGACFSQSEDTIYFASNRPGGYGGLDLYISVKLPDGSWGKPQNLGNKINSKYDENYPQISYNGNEIYYASKGFNSMGGYDIFKSKKINGQWFKPQNIGYPLNDTYDNNVISFVQYKRYAYISKSLENGFGYSDVYKVIFNDIPPPSLVYTGTIRVGKSWKSEPLEKYDEDIDIIVTNISTGEKLKGFSYNKTTKKYVVALKPGKYQIKITGEKYMPLIQKIEIHDVQALNIVNEVNLFLNLKQ